MEIKYNYSDVIKTSTEINKNLGNVIYQNGRPIDFAKNKSILHFGSGKITDSNHLMYKSISKKILSVDADVNSNADFRKISDIKEKFEIVIAEHVFEHIPFEKIGEYFKEIHNVLEDDGEFLLTIPNIRNIGAWFSNYEHVNYAPHEQIAAIAELEGLIAQKRFGWSRIDNMLKHSNMSETEKFLVNFLEQNYGLQLYSYISYIFKKS